MIRFLDLIDGGCFEVENDFVNFCSRLYKPLTTQIGIRLSNALLSCLDLVNVVIILGRSLRFRRAVAVQCVHAAAGRKTVSLKSRIGNFSFTHL